VSEIEWIKPLHEGSLSRRVRIQDEHLALVDTVQPDRDQICERNQQRARQDRKPRKLGFGRYLGEIPLLDVIKLQTSHPDLFSPDKDIARKALIRFWNSPEAKPFRVQRA